MRTPYRFLAAALALLLAGPGRAQTTPPAWQLLQGSPQTATAGYGISAAAADAAGNVFVTGNFFGTVTVAGTTLTSTGGAGRADVFVAKWDATAQAFTWAVGAGGSGDDVGTGIAVRGSAVYVVGNFRSNTGASVAGQALVGAGSQDVFVAKYLDAGTGHTPATSGVVGAWAVSAGGPDLDYGAGIAVSGTGVFVTGSFSGTAGVAGQALTSAGSDDLFVAKYLDTSTGSTPATSSVVGAWALSGGGTGSDAGQALAVSNSGVYVTGIFRTGRGAVIAGQAPPEVGGYDLFVAKYLDASTGSTPATSSYANGWVTGGGGQGYDYGQAIVVRGAGVYVAGSLTTGAGAVVAGQALPGAGSNNYDLFVAKYLDTSTGSTPATSSVANGWALSGGGTGLDQPLALAVSGSSVLLTGYVGSGGGAVVAGQVLPGTSGGTSADVLVAKYLDTSTGSTPATSSYANAWALSAGGAGYDAGSALAVSGQQVTVLGTAVAPATFGGLTLAGSDPAFFLARLTDAALPLPTRAASAGAALALFPNPAPGGAARLSGAVPGATVQVLDALGRVGATATVGPDSTAAVGGLAPGLYVVRVGGGSLRLAVE